MQGMKSTPPSIELTAGSSDYQMGGIENIFDGDMSNSFKAPCDSTNNLFSLKFEINAKQKPPKIKGFTLVVPDDFDPDNTPKSFSISLKTA